MARFEDPIAIAMHVHWVYYTLPVESYSMPLVNQPPHLTCTYMPRRSLSITLIKHS